MKFCSFLCLLFFPLLALSQQFTGQHSSNYAGMNRATFNPSAIAGTRYKYHINLISFNSTVNHRYFKYFRTDALFHPFKATYTDKDMYGKSKLTGTFTEVPNVNVISELRLPSGYVGIGKNNLLTIGFGARLRGFEQGTSVAPIIADVYTKRLDFGVVTASNGSLQNMFINQHSFLETALTIAAMPIDFERFIRVKLGVTLKRLSGARNLFLHFKNTNYQVRTISKEEALLDLNNLSYEYGYTQPVQPFSFGSLFSSAYGSGTAMDAGATVEIGRISEHATYRANYIVRLGAAITDAGQISYPQTGKIYSGTISKLTLNQDKIIAIADNPAKNLETILPKTNAKTYDLVTQLPRTMNLDADIQFAKGFFINGTLIRATNKGALPTHIQQLDVFTLTPRFEGEDVECTFPISWIEGNKSPSIGFSVRFGPAYIGFSNFSGLTKINNPPRGTMVYLGFQLWKLNKTE